MKETNVVLLSQYSVFFTLAPTNFIFPRAEPKSDLLIYLRHFLLSA